ncbi:ABC-type transport auxiliary lipoprotein family protein [Halomonas sp. SSL-5]|uniref:ABC-type transport auxiliary lipoprotein family protein n=1 Tax=Halomonas sp. SSL-5 TaxID=3065855 RepID=UPI002738D426|nr:ABC-type transport auxiliary lipoprotein family protein [Halomonas sp. SSL-5]MDY7116919.1 ABC-type transport auxiliary lipoprotein family protein [Halomonas sp. SSL-5]
MPRYPRFLLLALLLALLAGCTILPEREPQRLFELPAGESAPLQGRPLDATLRIDSLSASAPHAGNRLLVMPRANEFEAWGGVRWRDDAPRLLQERLLEAFRRAGRLGGVIDEASAARSDATLSGHLVAFHLRLEGDTRRAVVSLDAELIDESSRELLASRRFEATALADDATPEAAVMALGQASDEMIARLLAWTFEELRP